MFSFRVIMLYSLALIPLFGSGVSDALCQIPIEDLCAMREFADFNFRWDQIAHPLFFDTKPCSLCVGGYYSKGANFGLLSTKGWQAYKKHEHLFKHKNFIFSETENERAVLLCIINKTSLKKLVEEHRGQFKAILGEHFSYEWMVGELKKGKWFDDVIQDDEFLRGLLLGFGEESSKAFVQRVEYNCINDPETYTGIEASIDGNCPCQPVCFAGNPHSKEVQQLVETYRKELTIFAEMYKSKDPLILFLEGLCQEEVHLLPGVTKSNWEQPILFPNFVMMHRAYAIY